MAAARSPQVAVPDDRAPRAHPAPGRGLGLGRADAGHEAQARGEERGPDGGGGGRVDRRRPRSVEGDLQGVSGMFGVWKPSTTLNTIVNKPQTNHKQKHKH